MPLFRFSWSKVICTDNDQSIKSDRSCSPRIDDNGVNVDLLNLWTGANQLAESEEDLRRCLNVERWRASESVEKGRALEGAELFHDFLKGESGWQESDVTHGFCEHAAKAGKQHWTPFRIVARAKDQFSAIPSHALYEYPLELEPRFVLLDVSVEPGPTFNERAFIVNAQDYPTGIAFVR